MNYYIHIPFCKSKCKYCHFASFSDLSQELKKKYLEYLRKEIKKFFEHNSKNPLVRGAEFCPETIYFGGGTPSILSLEEIGEILKCFGDIILPPPTPHYQGGEIEISLEANPEFITEEYVEGLQKLGINRISLGIQTLQEKSLEEIGRCKSEITSKALEILQKQNFQNVGIDFIIGLPYVKKGDTKNDIEKLLDKFDIIKHISVYMLEEGKYPENWKVNSLNEDQFGAEYEEVANFLEDRGFSRYELSNFAKSGFECRHNSGYWNHTEYAGFGLSAASFIGKMRFANASNFLDYFIGKFDYKEKLSDKDLNLEKLMFDFRTSGVEEKFVKNLEKLEEFKTEGLISIEAEGLKPTNKGIVIVDYIFKELFL